MLGHLKFVEEVPGRKAELVREQDSRSSTPLHLVAAKGYLNIVTSLLRVDPEICFVRDKDKRNPLHVVAMKNHVKVLECLVRVRPEVARSVVEHGQTILHVCMKHNGFEALKLLIDTLGDYQFINLRDEYGNTILHLAIANKQAKTIVLPTNKGVDPNILNSKGFTALGLLAQGQSEERALETIDFIPQTSENLNPFRQTICANNMITAFHPPVGEEDKRETKRKWLNSMHKALMVVAILLATMAFQASITSPGGLWQDTKPHKHNAGESIMAEYFIASLTIIMLLISGLPLERLQIITWIAMLTMWVAITFTMATYAISIWVFTPESELGSANKTVSYAVWAWVGLMTFIFLCHVVRLILKLVRKVLEFVRKATTKWKPRRII
ncbi:hypothetical protein BT93_H0326 [Corymbia citriodora subsp. variegata]|nr:hypothetical protein BT93_H0326 [Corymbia citriodora subsp. variegata]